MAFNIKVGGLEGFPCVGISFTAPLLGNNTIQNLFLHFFLFVYCRGKGEIIHLHFIISVLSKSLMVYKGSSVAMVRGYYCLPAVMIKYGSIKLGQELYFFTLIKLPTYHKMN